VSISAIIISVGQIIFPAIYSFGQATVPTHLNVLLRRSPKLEVVLGSFRIGFLWALAYSQESLGGW